MKTGNTFRQGDFAKICGWSKDALRSSEATGNMPYDRAALPGEKQKRYGPLELASVVVMDMLRAQGLTNAEAADAARCGRDQLLNLLQENEGHTDDASEYFVYHSFRVLMDPSGNNAGDATVGCDKLSAISDKFVVWAQGLDLPKDASAVKSGFAWVHSGPKIAVVNIRTALLHAQHRAKLLGYLISGEGFMSITSGQESDQ
ncbi:MULTISPECIES: hypothetical protein [unclassified Yoonia]|uniref:hypothetical protein n=1 Tax=unclassified Yoonia TaxID=2629118 RepID=UPI002AFF6DB6|nr:MULTISPECIES: hypothetical protein [unclassified Yoonia]